MMNSNAIKSSLDNEEISRYGRQLIMPHIGKQGQEKLKSAKILIVGCGGLGCPCSQYLVSAGIGTLGMLDNDQIDINNLHRQILYQEDTVGVYKVDIAIDNLSQLNSNVKFIPHKVTLTSENSMDILGFYDLIIDCTDNAATRYLINDTCVLLGKPYIFGAALRTDGQLSTYNFNNGPCYRCINPAPEEVQSSDSCSDAGVLGPVTGLIGSMQATEAIRVITNNSATYSGKLFICNPWDGVFRVVRLRDRRKDCLVCGENPAIKKPIDYSSSCPSTMTTVDSDLRITAREFSKMRRNFLTIDVRTRTEYGICRLEPSINIPIQTILSDKYELDLKDDCTTTFVICRQGNDSRIALGKLKGKYPHHDFKDVIGGLKSWSDTVDNTFPKY